MAGWSIIWTAGSWKFPIMLGIVGMVVGSILLFFPDLALHILTLLFALIALLVAVILVAFALFISRGSGGFFLVPLSLGILALLIAVGSLLYPGLVGALIAVLIGAACLIAGLGGAFTAGLQPGPGARRLLVAVGGIILTVLGILILLYRELTLVLIFQLVGAFLIVAGAVAVLGAVVLWWRERPPDPRVIDVYIEE